MDRNTRRVRAGRLSRADVARRIRGTTIFAVLAATIGTAAVGVEVAAEIPGSTSVVHLASAPSGTELVTSTTSGETSPTIGSSSTSSFSSGSDTTTTTTVPTVTSSPATTTSGAS